MAEWARSNGDERGARFERSRNELADQHAEVRIELAALKAVS